MGRRPRKPQDLLVWMDRGYGRGINIQVLKKKNQL